MDAQNAAESDQTTPAVDAPQRRPCSENEKKPKSPLTANVSILSKDPAVKRTSADDLHYPTAPPDDAPADRDSDAETIVLPGKDGHSPSKARKVRQEDKSESDGHVAKGHDANSNGERPRHVDRSVHGSRPEESARKKLPSVSAASSVDKDRPPRNKDAASSGLSSAPASPSHQHQNQNHNPSRRRKSDAALSSSPSDDSEPSARKTSSKASLRDSLKSCERPSLHKRKASKIESDDEADLRKARRQRTTSVGYDSGRPKDSRLSHAKHDNRNRSISPLPRQHRRSTSTQLPSHSSSSNGPGNKKQRLPLPLQSTDYQSDSSSTCGSPHPQSSKIRSLATLASADSNISPAKMGPHKKHLDAHGQTLLARACARGEYEGAKQRLRERPEDLNVADYAGNTPLQIAAINGCEDLVRLLIEAGCNLDCVNYDKDTPLLDAVDNGHLGVVKLLLDAGVNPRKANVNGEEPIDRVSDETDNADEIRSALLEAKKRAGERRRTSEDQHSHTDNHDARDTTHAPESPRQSPAAGAPVGTGRRTGTVRSTKTRNDLLYMPLDDKTLRQAAGRGDEETVARILQVKEGYDDPESMVAAARGGHDLVIQLLLGLGGANADPGPVASLPAEFATPILAAIGQENIKVVELLLEQQGFDPTRRFKGETYYEIARRRQGTNWKEEEHLLKNAYDEYKRSHKDLLKAKSPGGRRDRERTFRRDDQKEDFRASKRRLSSPSRDIEPKKKPQKLGSPTEKKRSGSITNKGDDEAQKRQPGRLRKEYSGISDREVSPAPSHKPHKPRRVESDIAAMSSEGETAKPRRKLVSKGELRGERDKQRRTSSHKEPSSPRDPKNDDGSEKLRPSEKYHDRAKALKRDETKDWPSGDGTSKRPRSSVTPDRPSDVDKESSDAPIKRRRLDMEGQESRQKRPSSEDGRPRKSNSSRDGSVKPAASTHHKDRDEHSKRDSDTKLTAQSAQTGVGEKSINVKSEDVDIPMPDLEPAKTARSEEVGKGTSESDKVKRREAEEDAAKRDEENRRRAAAEEAKRQKEAEVKKAEEEKQRKRLEEESRKRKEQEERERYKAARREEEERRQRLEEEKRRKEEEEKKRRIEEEKRRKEEEEKKRRIEEEKRRMEEERLRKEELEREAAEEARRQREAEERKERERRERAHREEMERKRAAREAELRRIREEQEQARLEKLPPLLRWLDTHPGPKTGSITEKFKSMLGIRYDTIRPAATGTPEGREQWLSDFLYTVPNIPHLRNVRLAVEYRELLENEAQLVGWKTTHKWKQDPDADRFHGFAPRSKYYMNGSMVGEDLPTSHKTSKTPFPEKRVPRRGLVQVLPDDPDYERICLEQGLEHLIKSLQTPSLTNGLDSSPMVHTMPNASNASISLANGYANGAKVNGIHDTS
ncbi:hypothetical protein UVI_02046270 [Ustilaginoidea virens]|uniref:Uncharacterized protein n=1 Tax=Ustilaginoidea virens TaxID=1159556 RepID=A0A1B5L0L5_USTVR|nr:hypothetical protein UVI_02046270 [Ustilaginoidea virens]